MNKNTMMIIAVVLIIVAAAGGFYAGMQYQSGQSRSRFAQGGTFRQGFNGGVVGQNGQNSNFRPVRGQVLSMGSNTLTVKLPTGGTEIVVLSGSTVFMNTQKATLSDLKTGDTVNVVGTANSDGSVTASDVQINPPGVQRPAGSPSASQ